MVTDQRAEVDWLDLLLDQLDLHWNVWFRPRLDGLTDDEFLWEPVAGCWSVRPGDDGVWRMDAYDRMDAAPDPPPFTTIAWRLSHIGAHCLGMRATNHFGDGPYSLDEVDWPATAEEGIAFVSDAYERWRTGVERLGAEGLHLAAGTAEGPHAQEPMAALVLHINREVIHHGAEVACLRDLYRHTDHSRG
jgi:hypothetical protein